MQRDRHKRRTGRYIVWCDEYNTSTILKTTPVYRIYHVVHLLHPAKAVQSTIVCPEPAHSAPIAKSPAKSPVK